MEQNKITKRVIDYQKLSFDHWYNAVAMIQDQAESTMDLMFNQATWIPQEGRNAYQSWMNVCQQERGRYKSYVEKGFATLEKFLTETTKTTEKAKKASPSSSSQS